MHFCGCEFTDQKFFQIRMENESLFPKEIWGLIFQYLDRFSFLYSAQVCKSWRNLLRNDLRWKRFQIIRFSSDYSPYRARGNKLNLKLVIIGTSGVGKTTYYSSLSCGRTVTSFPKTNLSVDFSEKQYSLDDGLIWAAQLWDTAGQERFQYFNVYILFLSFKIVE